jgi:hypothetical protein
MRPARQTGSPEGSCCPEVARADVNQSSPWLDSAAKQASSTRLQATAGKPSIERRLLSHVDLHDPEAVLYYSHVTHQVVNERTKP